MASPRETLATRKEKAEQATPSAITAISDRVRKSIAAKEIARAVTLVATPDQILHLDATGDSSLSPSVAMLKDAIFWIASMSKPILATLMLMLQDDGLRSKSYSSGDCSNRFNSLIECPAPNSSISSRPGPSAKVKKTETFSPPPRIPSPVGLGPRTRNSVPVMRRQANGERVEVRRKL